MGELLLGGHFTQYSQNDDVIASFQRGMGTVVELMRGTDPDGYLFRALTDLMNSQWTNPVLNKIMNGDEVDTDVGA